MKNQVRFFDIQWDADGAKIDALPKDTIIDVEMDDDTDIAMEGADMLSDKFGWCVKSFQFDTLRNEDNQGRKKFHIEKITGDNRRPGMPQEGYLVRHRPHESYGWLGCKACDDLEEAATFAASLDENGEVSREELFPTPSYGPRG